MKSVTRTIGAAAVCLGLAALAACATADQRRRNYVEAHPDLSEEVREAILAGDLAEGMTPDEVIAVRGKPAVEQGDARAGEAARWTYGYPEGDYRDGQYYGSTFRETGSVAFRGGKVSSWE